MPNDDDMVAAAVRANVGFSVCHLRHGSTILEDLIADDGLIAVGAEYSLVTGEVVFLKRGMQSTDGNGVSPAAARLMGRRPTIGVRESRQQGRKAPTTPLTRH
jgi:hypothetical protein